jgi:hypothetical protein
MNRRGIRQKIRHPHTTPSSTQRHEGDVPWSEAIIRLLLYGWLPWSERLWWSKVRRGLVRWGRETSIARTNPGSRDLVGAAGQVHSHLSHAPASLSSQSPRRASQSHLPVVARHARTGEIKHLARATWKRLSGVPNLIILDRPEIHQLAYDKGWRIKNKYHI